MRSLTSILKLLAVIIVAVIGCSEYALAGNPPVGGGGSCTGQISGVDGTQGQQQGYDNALYTCANATSWAPEALIVGATNQDGTAPSCTSTNAGMIEWDGANFKGCNGTTWTNFSPGSNPACSQQLPYSYDSVPVCCGTNPAVWGDGTYIYLGQTGMAPNDLLLAFTFNETTHVWTLKSNSTTHTTGDVTSIWGDGTYVYFAEGTTGIEAWTFNGTTWTLNGSYSTTMSSNWVWGDGTYIYVGDGTNGVKAFTFNGSAFTLRGTYTTSGITANAVWGDGTYIYVADSGKNKLRALSFNGTTFTLSGSISTTPQSLMGDGTYIYAVIYSGGPGTKLFAYTFNGTTFTQAGSIDLEGGPGAIFVKNGYIYVASPVIKAFTFTGTNFTYQGVIPISQSATEIWADSAFMFSPDASNFYSYFISADNLCH
jgi:hypothetical protein